LVIDMAVLERELEKATVKGGSERFVCFVCTGNTCRSPMAAAVFNNMSLAPEVCTMCDMEKLLNAKNIKALSAGLAAFGEPISENAVKALEEAGIPSTPKNDYKGHISCGIELDVMQKCELVVGMSSSHAVRLMAMFPQFASKITCMPEDIPDPWGGSLEDYKECLAKISEGVGKIYESL